jgi:hypothetical protein
MIDAELLEIPYTFPHICKVFPVERRERERATRVSSEMDSLRCLSSLANDGATMEHK